MRKKNPKLFIIFNQLISIYRDNIGKRVILNSNIGIIGHCLKDREINIENTGPVEGLKEPSQVYGKCSQPTREKMS